MDIENIPQSRSRHIKGNLPIWQRRYWEHQIQGDDDFQRHVEYIHFNPVKHGLVSRAIDYPWSTFRQYVRKGVYDQEWVVSDSYVESLNVPGE